MGVEAYRRAIEDALRCVLGTSAGAPSDDYIFTTAVSPPGDTSHALVYANAIAQQVRRLSLHGCYFWRVTVVGENRKCVEVQVALPA